MVGASRLIVCVGYCEHELLKPNLEVGPTGLAAQQRILSYVHANAPNAKTFTCSGAYSSWLHRPRNADQCPESVEVIGSWLGDCVMHAAAMSLFKGINVLLDPRHVIALGELDMSDDRKMGMALGVLERKFPSCRYTYRIDHDALLLLPSERGRSI